MLLTRVLKDLSNVTSWVTAVWSHPSQSLPRRVTDRAQDMPLLGQHQRSSGSFQSDAGNLLRPSKDMVFVLRLGMTYQ